MTEKEKRPQDWTAEERLNALMETGAMPEGERVSWCRKRGVFSHHLAQWKKNILSLSTPSKGSTKSKGSARLKKENAALKKRVEPQGKSTCRDSSSAGS